MHPEEIKAALRMKGFTLAALADTLGVSRGMVTNVVIGRAQSTRIVNHIAHILGKPASEIWTPKPQNRLRRTREQIAAQRAAAVVA